MVQGGETGAADGLTGFARALDELERRGSTLLVVGSVPEEMYARISAKMLGDSDASNRRRLVVTPGPGLSHRDVRLANVSRRTPEWTRIVQYETRARGSATAVGGGGSAVSSPDSPANADGRTGVDARDPLAKVVDGEISELGSEIATTIAQFDGIASGLAPAELRVAFDCLPALLSEYGRETVFRFLHVLGNDVRSVGGMGHVWLPRDRDAEAVRLFEPLFDATVELRLDGRELRQRWQFRDANLSSEWLSVE